MTVSSLTIVRYYDMYGWIIIDGVFSHKYKQMEVNGSSLKITTFSMVSFCLSLLRHVCQAATTTTVAIGIFCVEHCVGVRKS